MAEKDPNTSSDITLSMKERIEKRHEMERQKALELEKLEIEKKQEAEKEIELHLTGDAARAWKLLEDQVCSESDIQQAFLEKITVIKTDAKISIVNILEMKGILTKSLAEKYLAITSTQRFHKGAVPKTSEREMKLAFSLVDGKKISNEDVQVVLRTQASLYQIGIHLALLKILVDSHLIEKNFLDTAEKAKKEVTQKHVRKQAIQSAEMKKYPVLRIMTGTFIVIIILVIMWFDYISKQHVRLKKEQVAAEEKAVEEYIQQAMEQKKIQMEKNKKLYLEHAKQLEKERNDPKKQQEYIDNIMKGRGLTAWGNHWIPIEQYERLSKNWQVGSKANNYPINFQFQSLSYKNDIKGIEIRGRLDLPRDMDISLDVMLTSPFHQYRVYASKIISITTRNTDISLTLGPFSKSLAPGFYIFHLQFKLINQSQFTKYFLDMSKNYKWEFPFAYRTTKIIQETFDNSCKELESFFEFTNEIAEKIKEQKQENSPEILKLFKVFEDQKNKIEETFLVPVFPQLSNDLHSLQKEIYAFFAASQEQSEENKKDSSEWDKQVEKYDIVFDNLYLKYFHEKDIMANYLKTNNDIYVLR